MVVENAAARAYFTFINQSLKCFCIKLLQQPSRLPARKGNDAQAGRADGLGGPAPIHR